MSDDYSDWVDLGDAKTDEGMSLLDPVKNVAAEAANFAASQATAGQLAAEKSGMPRVAGVARAASMGLHQLGDYVESGISESGRRARDAALIPQDDQEQLGSHPLRELVMKASSAAVPVAAIGAGSAAGPAGTAGAGAWYGYTQDLDKAIAWTNSINDEELAKAAPVFDQKKLEFYNDNRAQGMDEEAAKAKASADARTFLHKGLFTGGQALVSGITNAAMGVAGERVLKGSSLGEGLANYVLTGNAVRSTAVPLTTKQIIGKEAIEGAASALPLGAASAASDYSQQQSENFAKGKDAGTDVGRSLTAFLNGTAEGVGFHFGVRAAQKGPGKINDYLAGPTPEPPRNIEDAFKDKKAANVPPDGSIAASTGATPKTTRADTQPPPNEAAQEGEIGNTVNPPTRDQGVGPAGQKIKAKKRNAQEPEIYASVEVINEKAPASDEAAALAATLPDATTDLSSIQVPPPREPGPEPLQRLEVPDDPITPEVSPATEVPEAGPTIEAQLADLTSKKRSVMRFNNEGQVPAERPKGVYQHKASDGTVWWYRTGKGGTSKEKIEASITGKTENELLGLGPFNKEQVAADVAAGGEPTAVVARTPEGTEVAAAASTDRLAPDTIADVQAANPDATVTVETPDAVIAGREAGTGIDPNAFDEALARREAEEQLRTAQPKIGPDGRRILPAAPTEENISALVEQRRAEWEVEQEKAAAEERRAKRDLEEAEAEEKAGPQAPQDFTAQRDRKRVDRKTENRAKSDDLFATSAAGRETKGRAAIIARAEQILADAKAQGVSVIRKLDYSKHSAAQAFLKEAQILVSAARDAAKKQKLFPEAEAFNRFAEAEFDLRDGLEGYDRYKKNRQAEGDARNSVRFDETRKKGGRQLAEEDEGPQAAADELTGDDLENEGQAKTLGDVAVDREAEDYSQEPTTQERPKVTLKGDEFTAVTDKSGEVGTKIKVETRKDRSIRKPQSRPIALEDELLAGMDPVEDRTTGEREGYVSYDYGRDTRSVKIDRTVTASDLLREMKAPSETLAGKLFPLIRMRLSHIAGDVKVHFVDRAALEDMVLATDPKAKGIAGYYKPKLGAEGGYVVVARDIPAERQAHIYTHELLHAATEDALRQNKQFRDQIDAIMAETKALLSQRFFADRNELQEYGFTNASEFLAEAFSNPKFQEILNSVQISDKLARQLGLEKRSLWSALVDRIREAFRLPPGSYTALEALVKPTNDAMTFTGLMKDFERMDREAATSRPYIGEELVESARQFGRDRNINSKNLGRRFLRASASNTMLARMSARLGPKFGYWARKANELHEQMAVRVGNLLDRKGGGLEIVREGDALRRRDPKTMTEAMDIGWEITEHNLDMSAGAKNEHIFGKGANSDILAATQAKEAYGALRKRLDALPSEYREWLEKSAKFFREEDNAKRLAVIKRVLKEAEVEEPGLAERILDGQMTAADEAKFKTNAIVKHLNEVAELKRLKGWYFPLERDGDFVLTAERRFSTPAGKHIERLKDADGNDTNELLVVDPNGRERFAPARRAAQTVMRDLLNKDKLRAQAEWVYVLKSDGKTIVPKEEAEAIGAPATFKAYKVTVQTQHLSMYANEAARNNAAQELQTAGYRNISQSVRRDNPNAKWGGLIPSQMETIINSLQRRDKFKNLSDSQQSELIQSLRQATIKLLPGSRIQHHNLQRRNVEGYSRDMINSIARSAQQSAAFRARTEFQPEVNRALQGMQSEITKDRYSNRTQERQELQRELENRLALGNDIKPPSTLEKGLNFVNKLSMLDKLVGPSFHIINAQEPWTTAAPVIGGRHGFVNAARMLKGAYNMIGARGALAAGFRDTKLAFGQDSGFTDYRKAFQSEIARNISGDRGRRINEMLDHLHDLNLFGHEAGMEVQRLAQPAQTMIGRGVDRVDLMSRQVGQAIEAINRAVTGIAAYELEFKRNGGNHQAAMRYAHDTVHDTMGNYSASNAAPVFNNPLGKSALQFKKFAQRTYFLLGKMAGDAARGDREAQRAFAGVMFTHAVVAGALGLPLEPIKIALMASGALGGYSYDDFEALVRDTAAAALGKTGGEAVTRGLPRALLGVDTSGRQSLADLLTFGKPLSGKPNDLKAWLFDTVGGAPLGMPLKAVAAAQAALEGDVEKVIDNAIPVKAIRDIGRAGFGLAGGKRDRTGRQMMEPYSPYEAAVQALGFTPGRKAEEYEERSRVNNESFHRKEDRTGLINDWVNATPAGKTAAWRAVQEFNRDVPKDARITMQQLQTQAKNRVKEKAEGKYVRGMRVGKQNRDIFKRAEQTY